MCLQTDNFIVPESDDKRDNDSDDSDDSDDNVPEPQCLVPHPCGGVPGAAQLTESN